MLKVLQRLRPSLLVRIPQKFPFPMEGSNKRILRSQTTVKTVEKKTIVKKSTVKSDSTSKSKSEVKIKKTKTKTVEKKEAIESENFGKQEKDIKSESESSENASRKRPGVNLKKESIKPEKAIKIEPEHAVDIEDSVSKPEKEAIKSEYFEEQEKSIKSESKSSGNALRKRPGVNIKKESIKPENSTKIKLEHVTDIEDGVWKPENWEQVLENILKMRKLYVAPVDSLGCEECPEKGVPPEVFRYQTLISVMLSSQTRDEVTFAATQRLIEHGLTVDNILNTPDEKIGELIYPAGFWKTKIKFIKNTSQILKDNYRGDIPRTFKELCKLPGVGPKMANIVMSVAWKETVGIAVDTHVHRISNRLGWVPKPTKDPEHTRKALESWMPKKDWRQINLTLVGFGQTVCKPIGPSCEICLNKDLCSFGQSVLSSKSKKKKRKEK